MKCYLCGAEPRNGAHTPRVPSFNYADAWQSGGAAITSDYAGTEIGVCNECSCWLYRTIDTHDWLHLATDRRGCGEEL